VWGTSLFASLFCFIVGNNFKCGVQVTLNSGHDETSDDYACLSLFQDRPSHSIGSRTDVAYITGNYYVRRANTVS